MKFCDPLGDKNVYWSLKEFQPNILNQSVAIVAARLDAASMFQDLSPGALSTATSIVTLMTTANLISEMLPYNDAVNYSKFFNLILFVEIQCIIFLYLSFKNFIHLYYTFLAKNIMFILFNGEAYDYIGSSRMVYDMLNGNFPNDIIKFNRSHVGLYVELSQIHYDDEIVFHHPVQFNVCICI